MARIPGNAEIVAAVQSSVGPYTTDHLPRNTKRIEMFELRPVGPWEWLMLYPAQAFDLGYRVRGLQPRFGCGLLRRAKSLCPASCCQAQPDLLTDQRRLKTNVY